MTQLVRDLAESVGLLDRVKATSSTLASTLWLDGDEKQGNDTSRPARCLLLSDWPGGNVVGFAVYYYTYSTWLAKPGVFLEDLFVRPHERGKGYGKKLLAEVAKRVEDIGGGRLHWYVRIQAIRGSFRRYLHIPAGIVLLGLALSNRKV